MCLSSAHGQQFADGAALDHRPRAHDIGREDLCLGIAVHDTGLANEVHHLGGLGAAAGQRLRADDRLTGGRRNPGRGKVQVVRKGDDDQVDLLVCAQLFHGRVLAGHAVATPKLVGALV